MKLKRLFRTLFRRRKPDPTGRLIRNVATVRRLIVGDHLYVDPRKPYATLSLELHLAHIDDELKLATFPYCLWEKLGLVRRDRRYIALMSSVLAYINFRRAMLGMPMHDPAKPLNFLVMNHEKEKPLLVGALIDGRLDYRPVSEK